MPELPPETLRMYLRMALKQIQEFRRECDPREDKVLVSHVEMMGPEAFEDGVDYA